jgi:hypothetical protein
MTPTQYADGIRKVVAESTLLGGTQKAKEELYPLIFYFTVNWTRASDPNWLTQVQGIFERESRIARPDFVTRLTIYDHAASSKEGGGPMWATAKAYVTFVTQTNPIPPDLDQFMPVVIGLGAPLEGVKVFAELHLSE